MTTRCPQRHGPGRGFHVPAPDLPALRGFSAVTRRGEPAEPGSPARASTSCLNGLLRSASRGSEIGRAPGRARPRSAASLRLVHAGHQSPRPAAVLTMSCWRRRAKSSRAGDCERAGVSRAGPPARLGAAERRRPAATVREEDGYFVRGWRLRCTQQGSTELRSSRVPCMGLCVSCGADPPARRRPVQGCGSIRPTSGVSGRRCRKRTSATIRSPVTPCRWTPPTRRS